MIIPRFSKSLEKQVLTKEPHEVQEDQKQDRASGAEEAGALTGRAAALQKSA